MGYDSSSLPVLVSSSLIPGSLRAPDDTRRTVNNPIKNNKINIQDTEMITGKNTSQFEMFITLVSFNIAKITVIQTLNLIKLKLNV